ncbi:ECF transporter S component [Naumannella halotolerans]|uniref:Energy-coupling factor transport system substrate-specific component n=1 Tax=Naumannella halotolerans TaxID=993414 RepID=A0A4R7J3E0_9ACTN|nr:ECF transporter S component [Naumannella halotolerans]TDT30907.1 energy-coupling factor transport system substrate-specific component [Naumannella halotolerans]
MSTRPTQSPTDSSTTRDRRRPTSYRWRVVDIVVAAVLGVATGLIFVAWNVVGYAWFTAMDALTPGIGGIAVGIWLLGGVLGGLIIRKPGAALFVELLASVVSMLLGSQWSIETVYSGIAQGLGAELIFAIFAYRRFGLVVAALAGMGAAAGAFVLELFVSGNLAKSPEFLVIYLVCLLISGAILAGLIGWLLTRALAATGVLDRFAAGREVRKLS